jgi:lipopolysaccharide biosynthesis protein
MIAIILHLYYQDLWDEFKEKIVPLLNDNVHLYVTVNDATSTVQDVMLYAKDVYILENRGIDFGPFVYTYDKIRNKGYSHIIKVHTKKSLHNRNIGTEWRKKLTEVLIGNPEIFNSVIETMKHDDRLFMAGPYSCFYDRAKEPLNSNGRTWCLPAMEKLNLFFNIDMHGCFIAGSMFAVSTKYLDLLFNNSNLEKLYNEFEIGYSVNTSMAHAMERMIGYGVEFHNGKFLILNPS